MPRPATHLLITAAQSLRIRDLHKNGVFTHPNKVHFIPLAPTEASDSLPLLACAILPKENGGSLAIAHSSRRLQATQRVHRYWVELATSPVHFGGIRYWFLCPGQGDAHRRASSGCSGRRTTTLYLPAGKERFLCRDCHKLTYRTKQLHYRSPERKSRPSLRSHSKGKTAPLSVKEAREKLHEMLREMNEQFEEQNEAKEEETKMARPKPTLRQQAVWYLWGMRRINIPEIAALFGVTPRTISRDLAALRARGWRRPRAKAAPRELSLDLIVQARSQLEAVFRGAFQKPSPQGKHSYSCPKEDPAHLQQAALREADLALAASQLLEASEREQAVLTDQEMELMREELAIALATMLGR